METLLKSTMKLSYRQRTGQERSRNFRKSTGGRASIRRYNALERLRAQLELGTKPFKAEEGAVKDKFVEIQGVQALLPADVERIKKEIAVLEQRT